MKTAIWILTLCLNGSNWDGSCTLPQPGVIDTSSKYYVILEYDSYDTCMRGLKEASTQHKFQRGFCSLKPQAQ